ncbi:hypothetical protein BH925_08470 [Rodentibacter pneumotropicus]|nr:hypothetical protein BH925_08470 [Rodentibacter pneumotropicus]
MDINHKNSRTPCALNPVERPPRLGVPFFICRKLLRNLFDMLQHPPTVKVWKKLSVKNVLLTVGLNLNLKINNQSQNGLVRGECNFAPT